MLINSSMPDSISDYGSAFYHLGLKHNLLLPTYWHNWLELLGSIMSNFHYVAPSDNELDQVTIKRCSSGNFNKFETLTRPIRGFTDIDITQVLLTEDN